MLTKNYTWLFINEKDEDIYDNAFIKTSNLYCNHNSYELFCPSKNEVPFLDKLEKSSHKHAELWNPKNSSFLLVLDTDENPHFIKVIWKKLEIN